MKKVYYDAGIRIRNLREKKHLTREQVAEKANISSRFLYEVEVGNKGFSADTLFKLVEVLDTSADYILTGRERINADNEVMDVIGRFEKNQINNLIGIIELIYKILETQNL